MLLFEHDAKELLAVQGVPVPGGIRLDHIPDTVGDNDDARSGPWVVKPQFLRAANRLYADFSIPAHTTAEVAAAASQLIGSTIADQKVESVWVERQFDPREIAAIRFECDWGGAGINLTVAEGPVNERASNNGTHQMLLPPEPGAVVEGLESLVGLLSSTSRDRIREAGRQLTPLFFGYEALLLEIDPLMLLDDGGWAVGGVNLSLDENALFRHPELVSMIERRANAYAETRLRRRFGLDHLMLNNAGTVAALVNGRGASSCVADELQERGVAVHSVTTADTPALSGEADSLNYYLDWLRKVPDLRVLLISIAGEEADLTAFAQALDNAIGGANTLDLPIILRFLGGAAANAAATLHQAHSNIAIVPTAEDMLDAIALHGGGPRL